MKDVYLEKNKLFEKSTQLRNLSMIDCKNSVKIKEEQNKAYKKWKFLDGFLKAENKRK